MIIEKIENFGNKNFGNTKPTDLIMMDGDEIIELISNTFKTKIISQDDRYTILESEWHHIENLDATDLLNKDIIGKKFKVYFYLTKQDYSIIRGDKSSLNELLSNVKSKFPYVANRVSDPVIKNSMLLKGKNFYNLTFHKSIIKRYDKSGEERYSISCNNNYVLSNKTISYYSNLIIGETFK